MSNLMAPQSDGIVTRMIRAYIKFWSKPQTGDGEPAAHHAPVAVPSVRVLRTSSHRGLAAAAAIEGRSGSVLPEPYREMCLQASMILDRNDRFDGICNSNISFVVEHDPDLMNRVVSACCTGNLDHLNYLSAVFNHETFATGAGIQALDDVQERSVDEKLEKLRRTLVVMPAASRFFTEADEANVELNQSFYYLDAAVNILAPETGASIRTLTACTALAYVHGVHSQQIRPESLNLPQGEVDFFVDNFDRIEPMLSHLITLKSTDVQVVRSMIYGAAALSEGAL